MKLPEIIFHPRTPLRFRMARSSRPSRIVGLFLSCVVALASPTALADDAAESADSPQVQYRKAHEAIKAKKWEEARSLLLGLWEHAHTYDVGSSLVFVEYQAQHYAAAANYAAFALQNAPPVEKPEEIDRLRRALEELKARVGTVTVLVNQPGAQIKVDTELAGTSPLGHDVYVDVGPHYFEARLGNHTSASSRVDALAGQTYRVELAVQPEHAPAVEGDSAASTSGGGTHDSAEPSGDRSYAPAIVAASVGALGLTGGIVSFVISANKHADAQDRLDKLGGTNPCGTGADPSRNAECSEISSLADGSDTFRALGFVGLGTAVAGGVFTYVLWPKRPASSTSWSMKPVVSAGKHGMFAAVRGEF